MFPVTTAKLKAVARYEFGEINTSGNPAFSVEVSWEGQHEPKLFGRLDRYGNGIIFGEEALKRLGWSQEEANKRVRAFHM